MDNFWQVHMITNTTTLTFGAQQSMCSPTNMTANISTKGVQASVSNVTKYVSIVTLCVTPSAGIRGRMRAQINSALDKMFALHVLCM